MDFNEKGFLGTAISEFTVSAQARYSDFFDACYRINELAQATKFEFTVHNRDGQEVLTATMLLRLLSGFQSVIILAKMGLVIDAKVVLRGILEALFILKLLCEEETFVAEYAGSDQARRLKWMNIAHQNKDPNFESVRKHATPDVMDALRQEIAKHNYKKIDIEDVARRAGLQSMYNADYRLLSEEVHTLPRAIEHLTSVNDKGDTDAFDWGPSDKSLDYILFTAVRVLFIALVSATKLFGVDKTEDLTKIDQTLTRLAPLLKA